MWHCLPPAASAMSAVSSSGSPAATPAVVGVGRPTIARHLNPELSPVQNRSIHRVHRIFGIPLVVKAHEGEPPALFRVSISGNINVPDSAVLFKDAPQGLRRRAVR